MNFEFKPLRYDDGSGSDHWYYGIYKITFYEPYETDATIFKGYYGAYFKPHGWKCWGNSVRKGVVGVGYKTLEDAMADCEAHAALFSDPRENDVIPEWG